MRGTVDSRGKRDFENGHGMVCRCGGVRIREEKQHLEAQVRWADAVGLWL